MVIAELREEAGEALTLAAIAERLNAAGYRTARGKAFGRATVPSTHHPSAVFSGISGIADRRPPAAPLSPPTPDRSA